MTAHIPSVDKPDAAPRLCSCHGFGASDVEGALNVGAEAVAQVFRHIGVCAKCGDCVPGVRDTLRDSAPPLNP